MLDEEIRLPRGSDANLLLRMHKEHEKNPQYKKPKMASLTFVVVHYAGEVLASSLFPPTSSLRPPTSS